MTKRVRISNRIPLEEVMMFMTLFFASSYALLEHVSVSIPFFSMLKLPLLYAGAFFLFPYFFRNARNLLLKKYFYIFLSLLLFFALLWMSALNTRNTRFGSTAVHYSWRLTLYFIELFSVMIWMAEHGKVDTVIRFLFGYILVLVIATDVLLLTKIMTFYNGRFETYLIGNKFTVSYMHMNLLALWFIKNNGRFRLWQKSKLLTVLAASVVVIVAIYIDCMTGVLGCLALIALFAALNTPFERKILRLSSPGVLVLFLVASVLFPFISHSIVSVPFVRNLLENILGRSDTLTGRLNIFDIFTMRMQGNWLWGFGYGNGNAIAQAIFGYANAQNAVLYWVLQTGILATAGLILLFLSIFGQLSKCARKAEIMPLAALIYVYIIMGAVETTFSMAFLMWIAVIFMCVNERYNGPVVKKEVT